MVNHSDSMPVRRARIDCDALRANVASLAVAEVDVSADAFGHGAENVVRAFDGRSDVVFTAGRVSEVRELSNRWPDKSFRLAEIDSVQSAFVYGLREHSSATLLPVMTLESTVLAVKTIAEGGGVSYGYTWTAPRDGNLALVALGYADGFNRAWGNRVSALTSVGQAPAVGRVAMDAHSIWTGDYALHVGDVISYFGNTSQGVVFAQNLADVVGSSPLSVTSNLGARIERVVNT